MRHHIRRGLTTTPATLIIAATSILCGGNIRFVSGRADTLRQVNASNDNILNIIDDSLAPTSDPLNLIEEETNVINNNSSAPTTLSPVESTNSPTTGSPVSNAPISEAPISPAPISSAPVTAYPTEPPIALTSPPTKEDSSTTEQQFVTSQVVASQMISTKMVSFTPPWQRNTDWSNMGSTGECSIGDDDTATRIDEDDGGVLTILNGLMNTVIPSEGLLFRTPDYLNDEWVPGSHVNNLFRTSNPAYSLTYLSSSSVTGCTTFNGKDFVDWCQSDGLRPPTPPGSCGGPGFCAEDFIGCPLTTGAITCSTDNNGGPLPDCSGKANRWDNAVVAGVYGRKYKANDNTDLKLPDGSSFYTDPTNPVVTNVCYPTDANSVDFRSDGSGTPLSQTGNGGCRDPQDTVCGPGIDTCLSFTSNNCECDYNGQFGGNGVSGLQAGQQIATYNNGICGQVTPPAIGAGNLQPSDYVDAAACWYDTSVPIAMNNLVSHSNTMWLRRDDWLNWVTPAKLPAGGIGELSYHGWNECTVRIPGATSPNPSIREFQNMDALTIILPALTDPGDDDRWSLCDLSFDALERLADTLDALWYRGYKDNQVPVVVMQQVQGKETDPNNDRFCKNYWDDTACTNGYRKTFFKQIIRFPIGDSCLLMDTDGEVYFKKDGVGFGTPCADNPLWVGTNKPSGAPSVSSKPSILPTDSPSESPSGQPSDPPTRSSQPTVSPSSNPTSTSDPTAKPSNSDPTESPTLSPTLAPTLSPTLSPTLAPTLSPTLEPTLAPTLIPTLLPTLRPTLLPTLTPSREPTLFPTLGPTELPTLTPTDTVPIPTLSPTFAPSFSPTRIGGLPPRPTTGPPFAKPPKPDDGWGKPPPVDDWGGSVPKPPKPAPIDDWGGSGGDTSNDAWNQPPPPPDLKPIFGWGHWGKSAKSKSSKSSKSQWGKSGKSGGWMDYDGQGIHYWGKSSKKGKGSSKYSNYNYANQVDGYTIAQPNKAEGRIQSVLCLSVVTLVMTALLI